MALTLENYFLLHPQAEALCYPADGKYIPGLAEHITSALLDGASLPGFEDHVQGKVKYVHQWTSDSDKVTKIMTTTAKGCELVVISKRGKQDRGSEKQGKSNGSSSSPFSKSRDKKRDGEDCSKKSITCYECDEEGHTQRQCKKGRKRRGQWQGRVRHQAWRRCSECKSVRRYRGTRSLDYRCVGNCPRARRFRCWRNRQRGFRRGHWLGYSTRCYYAGSVDNLTNFVRLKRTQSYTAEATSCYLLFWF